MERKQELIQFLDYLQDDTFIGVYYLDKEMNFIHYSIYSKENISVLKEKLNSFSGALENDLIKILSWKSSDSEEYLIGVYDGLIDQEKGAENE